MSAQQALAKMCAQNGRETRSQPTADVASAPVASRAPSALRARTRCARGAQSEARRATAATGAALTAGGAIASVATRGIVMRGAAGAPLTATRDDDRAMQCLPVCAAKGGASSTHAPTGRPAAGHTCADSSSLVVADACAVTLVAAGDLPEAYGLLCPLHKCEMRTISPVDHLAFWACG
jgi:hypothetical protein